MVPVFFYAGSIRGFNPVTVMGLCGLANRSPDSFDDPGDPVLYA